MRGAGMQDGKAVSFLESELWLDRLRAKSTTTFTIELPLYPTGDAVVTFKLDGADQALAEVKSLCSVNAVPAG